MRWTKQQLNDHPKRASLLGEKAGAQNGKTSSVPVPAAKKADIRSHKDWHVVGGRRIFFRSRWEVNYAFYLEFQRSAGLIKSWEYEPTTFWFPVKRGTNSYKPDFFVVLKDGTEEYHEVKGFTDRKSKTKLKRMRIHHPHVNVKLFDKTWFEEHRALKKAIPGWQ